MPLNATNFVALGPVKSVDMKQFYDLLTGTMTDQPVTFRNGLSIGGNQNVATVPLKLYGAPGQTTNLLDLYVDRTAAQPGFGFSAIGSFGWGPGGAAALDTFMSRIAQQNGHADDTAGILINPGLEVVGPSKFGSSVVIAGALTAGSLNVSGGGLGTIGATRINFSPSAFIQAYGPDNTYIELPKLTVTPGRTSLAGLDLNGSLVQSGANNANFSQDVGIARNLGVSGLLTVGSYLGVVGRGYFGNWDGGQALNVGGNLLASGYIYNRGSTAYRCWDNADFTFGVGIAASTVVQRDGSGQIQANSMYMPSAPVAASPRPAYVWADSGDGWVRRWPANAIGPPSGVMRTYGNFNAISVVPGGAGTTLVCNIQSDGIGISGSGGPTLSVTKTGYYAIMAYVGGGTGNWDNGRDMALRIYTPVSNPPERRTAAPTVGGGGQLPLAAAVGGAHDPVQHLAELRL
jgi:hypothetical protein